MFADRRIGLMLMMPAMFFVGIAFLLPVLILLAEGLRTSEGWSLARYTSFFSDSLSQEVMLRTLRLGFGVTLASAIIGYGVALTIANASPLTRSRMTALFILPLMISPVARTYAWIVLLGRTGLINKVLIGIGLTEEPLRLLFSETAVFIGLLQLFLPLMVLSLTSALENMPSDIIPAARILGANWLTIFFRLILPLTREGLIIGGTLVFTGAVTAYITPAVLGGSKVLMLETLLYQRISVANDVATASVIAAILIGMSIVTHSLIRRLTSGKRSS